MLTQEEKRFVELWSAERLKKKSWVKKYTIGWPLGVLIAVLLFVNVLSGWHKQAAMTIQSNKSVLLVIIVAALGIVAFITWFSYNHQWEMKEEQYQHLLNKLKEEQRREEKSGQVDEGSAILGS